VRILIQRGDRRLGPLTDDEARAALANGVVLAGDLAWRDGTAACVPLAALLSPRAGEVGAPPAPKAAAPQEPTTAGAPPPRGNDIEYISFDEALPLFLDPEHRERSDPTWLYYGAGKTMNGDGHPDRDVLLVSKLMHEQEHLLAHYDGRAWWGGFEPPGP